MAIETKDQVTQVQQVPACQCQSPNGRHQLPAPGRKISGAEANQRLLAKNAELYRRLAK